MTNPLPNGKQITIQQNHRPANYCMPSMEIATDHYDISYIISGDRKAITPLQSFTYHSGDVAMGSPYLYHRTISESDLPYDNYLIKYTPEFIEPFITQVGQNIFNELNEQRVCHFSNKMQPIIEQMFSSMLEEYNKNLPYTEFILQGMLSHLLTTIYENKLNITTPKYKSPLTEPIINALYYIENNYQKSLSLQKIAEKTHFSPAYFSRLFSSQLGISFSEYLSNVRIHHVKKLLINTNKSVMEIALDTGYCNGDYLSTQFKNKTGMTPSQFKYITVAKEHNN